MALQRPVQPMPPEEAEAIQVSELRIAYDARAPYQRNDDLSWINRAKRADTKQKRLDQIIQELAAGDVYMRMAWNGPK
jgi:uncharacterized protein YdeI (YjbR/CyaY-like superfamily)